MYTKEESRSAPAGSSFITRPEIISPDFRINHHFEKIPAAAANFRVLIVDDVPEILNLFRLRLESAGYDVDTAPNGEDALELIRKENFDVILLDLIMQGLTGWELLESVRSFSQVPILVFSALPNKPGYSGEIGADDLIPKLIDTDTLIAKIEAVLARRQSNGRDDKPADL